MGDWAVVIPSNRPDRLSVWRSEWREHFDAYGVEVYAVLDESPWDGIPEWVPRRTDMIRSWGLYQAWRDGHRYVASMDDDVLPIAGIDLLGEYEAAFDTEWPVAPWLDVGAMTGTGLRMRGFPRYGGTHRASIQYGGWDGVPDLAGLTQLDHPTAVSDFARLVVPVPRGIAVTTCAMNFATVRDRVPWCWQLPMVDGRYNRWGDIWSGLAQKRLCDLHNEAMLVNGCATVIHDRASDPVVNTEREKAGYPPHVGLWEALQSAGPGTSEVFAALVYHVGQRDRPWRDHALRSLDEWLGLFG